jgi:hypothetical protein
MAVSVTTWEVSTAHCRVASRRQEAKPIQQLHGPVHIDLGHTPAGVLDYLNTHFIEHIPVNRR